MKIICEIGVTRVELVIGKNYSSVYPERHLGGFVRESRKKQERIPVKKHIIIN
jgi:hypothetical protein